MRRARQQFLPKAISLDLLSRSKPLPVNKKLKRDNSILSAQMFPDLFAVSLLVSPPFFVIRE
jgi:hypothetical protein